MAEPLTLTEAKSQLRKVDDSEDTLITDYIVSARVWIENYTGLVFVSRAFTETFTEWGDYLTLLRRPVTALGDITYTDVDGDTVAYEDGLLWTARYPARVNAPDGTDFPTLGDNPTISVTYTAGYADADVPKDIKQAVRVLVTVMSQNRGEITPEAERAVKFMLASYRKPPLA